MLTTAPLELQAGEEPRQGFQFVAFLRAGRVADTQAGLADPRPQEVERAFAGGRK